MENEMEPIDLIGFYENFQQKARVLFESPYKTTGSIWVCKWDPHVMVCIAQRLAMEKPCRWVGLKIRDGF